MLVKTDETVARLRPQEARERTRETQAAAIRQTIKADEASIPRDSGMDVTREMDRMGRPMFTTEFVAKLKKLNPNLHYEVSLKDSSIGGIYILRPKPDERGERRQFICRCEPVIMPEYHVFKPRYEERPDPTIMGHMQSVPTVDDMIWGWRTVLARLVRGRYISLAQCDRMFGVPTKDSERWQAFTGQTI